MITYYRYEIFHPISKGMFPNLILSIFQIRIELFCFSCNFFFLKGMEFFLSLSLPLFYLDNFLVQREERKKREGEMKCRDIGGKYSNLILREYIFQKEKLFNFTFQYFFLSLILFISLSFSLCSFILFHYFSMSE